MRLSMSVGALRMSKIVMLSAKASCAFEVENWMAGFSEVH